MGLWSRQSGWKEKSQPESTVSVPCGLFLAILSSFVQLMRFWWIFLETAFCLIISQVFFHQRTGRLDDTSRDGRWGRVPLSPLCPLNSPNNHCICSSQGNQCLPTEPRQTLTDCPLCAMAGDGWVALNPDCSFLLDP